VTRAVTVQLWDGVTVVRRLGPDDPEPTPAELDAVAVAYIPWNDGVKPNVRVLAVSKLPWMHEAMGPAGSVPR